MRRDVILCIASFLFITVVFSSHAFALFQFVPLEGSFVQPGVNLDIETDAIFAFRILKDQVPHYADNGTNTTFRLWRLNHQTMAVEYLVGSDNTSVLMTKSPTDDSIWTYNYTIPSNATVGNYYAVYGVTITNQTYYSNIEVSIGLAGSSTGGSSGGGGTGNPLTLNCAQHAAPSYIVYCVSTANYPVTGGYASGETIGYKIINESLDTIGVGVTAEGMTGSYSFNFTPNATGNYIAYVNWTYNETNYSASDVVYAEIFKLTDEQNQTLYATGDRIESLNSTLMSSSNFGGTNLSHLRTTLEDLRAYYLLLQEEGSENAILVTDSISAMGSIIESYEKGSLTESEAEEQAELILKDVKSADEATVFGRLRNQKKEQSVSKPIARDNVENSVQRSDQTFIYYVKAIGILLLLLLGAYLLELDRKIGRFFLGRSAY